MKTEIEDEEFSILHKNNHIRNIPDRSGEKVFGSKYSVVNGMEKNQHVYLPNFHKNTKASDSKKEPKYINN